MANGTAAVSVRLPLAIALRAPDPKWPQPPKHREDHAFFGPESGPGDLSAQDIELLAEDEQFEILRSRRTASKEEQAKHLAQAD